MLSAAVLSSIVIVVLFKAVLKVNLPSGLIYETSAQMACANSC